MLIRRWFRLRVSTEVWAPAPFGRLGSSSVRRIRLRFPTEIQAPAPYGGSGFGSIQLFRLQLHTVIKAPAPYRLRFTKVVEAPIGGPDFGSVRRFRLRIHSDVQASAPYRESRTGSLQRIRHRLYGVSYSGSVWRFLHLLLDPSHVCLIKDFYTKRDRQKETERKRQNFASLRGYLYQAINIIVFYETEFEWKKTDNISLHSERVPKLSNRGSQDFGYPIFKLDSCETVKNGNATGTVDNPFTP